jgi:hypothetical protein
MWSNSERCTRRFSKPTASETSASFYHGEDVRQLFRLIDWLMSELQQGFNEELHAWEEEKRMPYVTSIERLAKAEGIEEGKAEGLWSALATNLQHKFGTAGKRLMPRVHKLRDEEQLHALLRAILEAESLSDIRPLLPR